MVRPRLHSRAFNRPPSTTQPPPNSNLVRQTTINEQNEKSTIEDDCPNEGRHYEHIYSQNEIEYSNADVHQTPRASSLVTFSTPLIRSLPTTPILHNASPYLTSAIALYTPCKETAVNHAYQHTQHSGGGDTGTGYNGDLRKYAPTCNIEAFAAPESSIQLQSAAAQQFPALDNHKMGDTHFESSYNSWNTSDPGYVHANPLQYVSRYASRSHQQVSNLVALVDRRFEPQYDNSNAQVSGPGYPGHHQNMSPYVAQSEQRVGSHTTTTTRKSAALDTRVIISMNRARGAKPTGW